MMAKTWRSVAAVCRLLPLPLLTALMWSVAAGPALASRITSVVPAAASADVTIRVTGSGLAATAADNLVTFTPAAGGAAVAGTVTAVSAPDATGTLRRLTVRVPQGLPVGAAAITVRNAVTGAVIDGASVQIVSLTLAPGSMATGATGDLRITLNGTATFDPTANRVTLGSGVTVNRLTVESGTALVVNVTVGATSAPGPRTLSVLTPVMTAVAGNALEVRPEAPPPQNQAPIVTAAAQPALVSAPVLQTSLTGSATDDGLPAGGTLTYAWSTVSGPGQVSFGTPAAATTSATFETTGTYVLRLTASDGALGGSATVTVVVNAPPAVDAGADSAITRPATAATLTGSVSDDGLPPGSALQITWAQTAGPAPASISSPSQATTAVTLPQAGAYVFQLTASDGAATASDTVTVTVNEQPNQPPTASAGPDQTIRRPATTVALEGVASDDGLPAGSALQVAWTQVSGPGTVTFANPSSPTTTATLPGVGVFELRLTASDGTLSASDTTTVTVLVAQNAAPTVDAGADTQVRLPSTGATLAAIAADDGYPEGGGLTFAWSQVAGPATATIASPSAATTGVTLPATAGTYVFQVLVSDGDLSATDSVSVVLQTALPTNTPPAVTAAADPASVTLPAGGSVTAALVGTAVDDGLPAPPALSYRWERASGPLGVSFDNDRTPQATARFSEAGTFVLRLTVSDGQLSASATTSVTVTQAVPPPPPPPPPTNLAPVVTAAASPSSLTLPANATSLSGTAQDDGVTGQPLGYSWSKVSGAGTVSFTNGQASSTSASFSSSGTYVLRLLVTDGQLTGQADVTVEVSPAPPPPPPANTPPVVTAAATPGSIALPVDRVTLTGSASDDGRPGGGLTYRWNTASGPAPVSFDDADAAATGARFTAAGTYQLRLTVSDGQESASQTVTVTVNPGAPPPPVNRAPTARAGGPYQGDAQAPVAFSGRASSDPDGDALTFAWTFGDGAQGTGPAPVHTYGAAGTYDLTLTVSDGRGGTSTTTSSAVIGPAADRAPPVVSLIAPAQALPGEQVVVTAEAVDNDRVAAVTFTVNGTTPTEAPVPPYLRTVAIPPVAAPGTVVTVSASAVDPSGNRGTASRQITIVAAPDTTLPEVSLRVPEFASPGQQVVIVATANDNVGVASVRFSQAATTIGTDRQAPYEATTTIPAEAQVGSIVAFTARATDFAGNAADATATVTVVAAPDTTAPAVTLSAPAAVAEGASFDVEATAQDNAGVASVAFSLDDVPFAAVAAPPYRARVTVPQTRVAGSVLSLRATATDTAGLTGSATAQTVVIGSTAGTGLVTGEVYDDTTGLPIAGAEVRATVGGGAERSAVTDARGRYSLALAAGEARLVIARNGLTRVHRSVVVPDRGAVEAFDARLTPLGDAEVVNATLGRELRAGDARVSIPGGALGANATVRVANVSAQGLAGLLPAGWSPVGAIDVAPAGLALAAPGSVNVPNAFALGAGVVVLVAQWDSVVSAWRVLGTHVVASGAPLAAAIDVTGQVAWLVPDTAPLAPPQQSPGSLLTGVTPTPLPADATVTVSPDPKITVYEPGFRSLVTAMLSAGDAISSGTALRARLAERYDFVDAPRSAPEPFVQDLVFYQVPGQADALHAQFVVSPSIAFEAAALAEGVISVELRSMAGPAVVLIGPDGGRAIAPTGESFSVGPGALTLDVPARVDPLPLAALGLDLPPALAPIAGVTLELGGVTLPVSGVLGIARPSDLVDDSGLVVARLVEIAGATRLEFVAVGRIAGDQIVSDVAVVGIGTPLTGVREGGRYVFLRIGQPFGYVTGIVRGVAGTVAPGIPVATSTLPLIGRANLAGVYVVPALAGTNEATATDPATFDTVAASVAVPAAGVARLDLRLVALAPRVTSVTPADAEGDVALGAPVVVSLSEPVDPSTTTAILVETEGGAAVAGARTLSDGNRVVTFRASDALASNAQYRVRVTTGVTDAGGRGLEAEFTSRFRTIDTSPRPTPAAGSISATVPGTNNRTTVRATQGTADLRDTVRILNLTRNTFQAALVAPDGSFEATLDARPTDRLRISITTPGGRETTVDLARFSQENPDGSITSTVDASGGVLDGPAGTRLHVPSGAFPSGAVVTMAYLTEEQFPIRLTPGQKQVTRFAGGLRLDFGGAEPTQYLNVSFPAQPGDTLDDRWVLGAVRRVAGQDYLTVTDTAKLIGGRVQTSSPPCPGVLAAQTYGLVKALAPVGVLYGTWPNPDPWAGSAGPNQSTGLLLLASTAYLLDPSATPWSLYADSTPSAPATTCFPALSGRVSVTPNLQLISISGEIVPPSVRTVLVRNTVTGERWTYPQNIVEFKVELDGDPEDAWGAQAFKGTEFADVGFDVRRVAPGRTEIRVDMEAIAFAADTLLIFNNTRGTQYPYPREALDVTIPVSGSGDFTDYEVSIQLANGTVDVVPFFVVTPRGPGNLLLRVLPVTIDPGTTTRLRNLTTGNEIPIPTEDIVAGRGGVEFPFDGSLEDRYQLVVSYDDGSRLPVSYVVPQVKAYAVNPRTNTVTSAYVLPVPPQDEPYNLGIIGGDKTAPFIVEAPLNLQNFDPQGFVSVGFNEGLDRDSVLGGTSIREKDGAEIEVEVRLTEGNRRVTIIPRAPLKLGRTYVVSFAGVTDGSGNPVATPTLTLKVFEPRRIGGTFPTGVYAPPMHLEPWRVKDAEGRTRVFALTGTHGLSINEPFVSLLDITNPEAPAGVDTATGFRYFETNDHAILQGLEDVPLSGVNPCTGQSRFTGVLGVQARQSQSSTLFGFTYSALDFYDLTNPSRVCLMGTKTVAGTNLEDPSVIEANGYPKSVALLPYEGGVLAYTAIQFVGLARVDVTQSIGATSPGRQARALLAPGNYRSVAITGSRIVALEQSTNTLEVFDPSLARIAQFVLDPEVEAFEIDIAEGFGVDADLDGRIAPSELRTLVFVAGLRGLGIVDITELSSTKSGFVPYAGGMFRVFADPISRRVLASTGGRFLVLDFSTPGSTEYERDADGDGLDDRIVWRSPAGLYQGQGGRVLNLDRARNLTFVSSGGAGTLAPVGLDTWALNSACCDLQIDLVKPAAATAPSGGRAELIELELKALKQGLAAGLDKAEACGVPLETIAIFEQGSGACIWKDNPASACASNYQPGLSDHDYEVLIPSQYLDLPGDTGKCLTKALEAEFINEDKSPKVFEIDGRKVSFEDVTFFPFAKDGFDHGLINILPPRGAGNDSDGDMGLGRQSLLLLWLLSGQYIQLDGRTFSEEPFESILQKLQSESGIPRLEGYEWANLQKFNLFKTKAFLRIAGSGDPSSAFHDLYVKQLHDTGKSAIRTVFARMVAHPDLNNFVWKVRRSAGDPLPPFALDGSVPVASDYPAFDSDACLSVLTPDSTTWQPKPCSGFEDYIASTAARSVLQGYDVFTAQEIYDVVHKFWRVKGDVPLPGRKDIRNEAEANAFIALAARYIDESLALNLPAYSEEMSRIPGDERTQRQLNLQKAFTNIEKKKKVSLQVVPRVSNLGFKAASDVPVVMYRGIGTAPGTRVRPKAGDAPVLVSLEGGDITHLDDLNEYVELEDDSADRNLLGAEILVTDNKKDVFKLGDDTDPVTNPLPDQSAEPGVVRWVAFTIDLDGPTRTVQEPNRANNHTGFHYYILDRENPAPPAVVSAPVPLPVPDPGNLLTGDEACDPPATVLLQQRFSFNDITLPDAVPMGATVGLEFEVSNLGQTRQSGLSVCSTLLSQCLPAGDLDPGQSRRVPATWPTPKQAGQVLAQASVISAEGGAAQAAPMLIVVGCEAVLVREPSPNPNPAGPSTVGVGGTAVRHFQVVERDGATPVPGADVVIHVRKGNGAPAEYPFTTDADGFVGFVDDSGAQPVFRRGVHVPVGAIAAVGDTFDVSFASIDGEGDCLTQVRFTVEVVDRAYQATFAAGPAMKAGGKINGWDVGVRGAFGIDATLDATLAADKTLAVTSLESLGLEAGLKATNKKAPTGGTPPAGQPAPKPEEKEAFQFGIEAAFGIVTGQLAVAADVVTSDKFTFPLPLTPETTGKVVDVTTKTVFDWLTFASSTGLGPVGPVLAYVQDDLLEEAFGLDQYRTSTGATLALALEGSGSITGINLQTASNDKVKTGEVGLNIGVRASGDVAVVAGAEIQPAGTPQLVVPSLEMRASLQLQGGFDAAFDKEVDPTRKAEIKKLADELNKVISGSADVFGSIKQEFAFDVDTGELQTITLTIAEKKKFGFYWQGEQQLSLENQGDGLRRSTAFKFTGADKQKLKDAAERLLVANALQFLGGPLPGLQGLGVISEEVLGEQLVTIAHRADEYEKTIETGTGKERTFNPFQRFKKLKDWADKQSTGTGPDGSPKKLAPGLEVKLKWDVFTRYVTEKGKVVRGELFPQERYQEVDPLIPANADARVEQLVVDAIWNSLKPEPETLKTATMIVLGPVVSTLLELSPRGIFLEVNGAAEPEASRPFDIDIVGWPYAVLPEDEAPFAQDPVHVAGRGDIPHNGIGGFFLIGPYDKVLAAPARMEIRYMDEEVAALDETTLRIYRWNDERGDWDLVGGTPDPANNRVVAQVTRLGLYTAAPPMPAGRPGVTAQVTPPAGQDDPTRATFTSDTIAMNAGGTVSDGTLFNVYVTVGNSGNARSVGTLTTADADPVAPGLQVPVVNGRLQFTGEFPGLLGEVRVLAWPAAGGTAFVNGLVSLR